MSLPRQTSLPSDSPSKSSLRRASGSRNPSTHFANEATQHHFLPYSPPNANLEYNEDEEAVADGSSFGARSQRLPPFQPFFTLIEDTLNNEHYHPTVHYIFADDDADIITEAACRSLDQDEMTSESLSVTQPQAQEDQEETRLPPRQAGLKEHYLILDVHPTTSVQAQVYQDAGGSVSPGPDPTVIPKWTYEVSSASSLSSEWQILRTNVTDAPTMGEQDPGEEGLMLRIQGRGNTPPELQMKEKQNKESVEEMVDKFQKRLNEIRQLIEVREELDDQRGDLLDEQD